MTQLDVERLSIRLTGRSAADGHRLALRVASGLGGRPLPDSIDAAVSRIAISLAAVPDESIDRLAERIVRHLLDEMERAV